MKQIILMGLLSVTYLGYGQTTHNVLVAVNQESNCPIINGLDDSSLISIFPNPVSNSFTLQSPFKNLNIRMYDMKGIEVRVQRLIENEDQIDVKGLKKGIYMLHVEHTSGSVVVKIIIE